MKYLCDTFENPWQIEMKEWSLERTNKIQVNLESLNCYNSVDFNNNYWKR